MKFFFQLRFRISWFQKMIMRTRFVRRFKSRRVAISVALFLFLTGLILFVDIIRTFRRSQFEYAIFGEYSRSSILHLLQSEFQVKRIELIPCSSCQTPPRASAAKQIIGVFVVFDSIEGLLDIQETPESDNHSSDAFINCSSSYDYFVYVVHREAGITQASIPDPPGIGSTVPAWVVNLLSSSIEECRSKGVKVNTWTVAFSSELTFTNVLNNLLIEAYFDNVTWYDISLWPEAGKNVVKKWVEDPEEILTRSKNVGVVVGQRLGSCGGRFFIHRFHYEIFGKFFPNTDWRMEQLIDYLMKLYSPEWLHIARSTLDYRPSKWDHHGDSRSVGSSRNLSEANIYSDINNAVINYELAVTNRRAILDRISCLPATSDFLRQDWQVLKGYVEASSKAKDCLRCDLFRHSSQQNRVIAMSLYGDDPKYIIGAVRNAQLLPVIFPGWRLWIYCERMFPSSPSSELQEFPACASIPIQVTRKLEELGAEVKYIDPAGLAPMMWRFLPVDDSTVDVFISRDSDSRLSERDAAVVTAWLATDALFHCIRDHPSHAKYPVNGGLWGARIKRLSLLLGGRSIAVQMKQYGSTYFEDMTFLSKEVWPIVQPYSLCHDSVSCDRWSRSHPIPVSRRGLEHMGQVFDENNTPRQIDEELLMQAKRNTKCEPERSQL